MAGFDWDDLRYVLAVADAKSLAGAARTLGVNHTTVFRRVSAFERRLGLRLFERRPAGYVLTAGGEELIAAARHIEDTVTRLERKLAGQDLRLSGVIRLTTTDTLMASVLPEILSEFHQAHPGIQIEVAVTNTMLNLSKRDADVAIRPVGNPPETLVGRRIGKVAFAIYGSRDCLVKRQKKVDLHTERWVAPDDSLAATSVARWMRSELNGGDIALRADSFVAMRQAAQAGLGLAALPCYLGDLSRDLVRVHPPIKAMDTALWVLTHEDLRHTARIRTFTEFAAHAFARRRPLLEGERARPSKHQR
ncbi:LysR family transcriptional regulator [Dongia deserti]|uniref:LysR family transcriptional regulator n=1 Tax=Dongia deserti TaxID=2268030 RepID=UPI000E64B924|nr:LysR family transcriptional regulator [Dongia deserti]